MATYNKFEQFVEDLGVGVHNLATAGDTLKIYATNNAPSASADAVKADLVGATEENGYAATDIVNDYSQTTGTATLSSTAQVVWTATAGGFGPIQYVVLFNSTTAALVEPLICWWDYGSSVSPAEGETFTVDFGASIFTLT